MINKNNTINVKNKFLNLIKDSGFIENNLFLAEFISRIRPIEDPDVPIMSVEYYNGNFYIHINFEYFKSNKKYFAGILLHEIHHILFHHITDPCFREAEYPNLMTISCEISCNEYIRYELPEHIDLSQYEKYGLKKGETTKERYDKLVVAFKKKDMDKKPVTLDTHSSEICNTISPVSDEVLNTIIEESINAVNEKLDKEDKNKFDVCGVRADEVLKQIKKTRIKYTRPNQLNWKEKLLRFTTDSREYDYSYNKPNRKYPELTGIIAGKKRYNNNENPSILAVIDTSGSMTQDELNQISSQLSVMKNYTSEITIIECDYMIRRTYPFENEIKEFEGGFATNFRPVFEPEFLQKFDFNGIVYFTDFIGIKPVNDPGVNTLWIITKDTEYDLPWGDYSYINE